jgi:hypothetical protein
MVVTRVLPEIILREKLGSRSGAARQEMKQAEAASRSGNHPPAEILAGSEELSWSATIAT